MSCTHAPVATRPLGSTGVAVSQLGLGGFHRGLAETERETHTLINRAVDAGITFMDNCWDYHEGESELRMGRALAQGSLREKVFLMSKIDGRTKKAAARQIDESLARLRTDRVDLMQFHEVIRLEDPDRIFADDGAIHAMVDAQRAGKVRFVGFSGHKDPLVHLRMLDVAREHGFVFDAVQMPLNVCDAHFRSFELAVLPRLVNEGVGVLAMKPLGWGALLESGVVTARECLRYALSLETSVVITGCERRDVLDQAIDVARTFTALTASERNELLARSATIAGRGRHEPYKVRTDHDGTAQHPHYLG